MLFAGIVAISFGSIFIRLSADVPPIMVATYRLLFSALMLVPLFKFRGLRFSDLSLREWVLCTFSGIFLALHFITWISSLSYTTVANSVVLVTMNPIFVGLFSYLFLRERMTIQLIGGIVLSVAGSLVLTLSGTGSANPTVPIDNALLGNLLALSGAVMASFYIIIGSKIRKKRDLISYITVVYSIAAVVLLLTSIVLALPFSGYKPASYLYMFLLALLPQMVGHTSFNWALKYLRSSMVAIVTMGEPVGATILAYLMFGETLTPMQIAGILLIFIAIYLASTRGGNRGIESVSSS